MTLLSIAVGVFILFGGIGITWGIQQKRRKEELAAISEYINKLQNKIKDPTAGNETSNLLCCELRGIVGVDDTLLSKIYHQLNKWYTITEGYTKTATTERNNMKKIISEIAHQYRTPLTNLETYLEFLKDHTITEDERSDYLHAVEISERKIHFLTESFVKMSRLENHIIQLKPEPGDLIPTIRNALDHARSRIQERNIAVLLQSPEHFMANHDSNWLSEALYNIIDNAVKYSYDGGNIIIKVESDEVFQKILIWDYGIGINPGEENDVFHRFYRGKNVTTQEGFGIGLYLARKIVVLHNGFLRIRSLKDGTQVEVYLNKKTYLNKQTYLQDSE